MTDNTTNSLMSIERAFSVLEEIGKNGPCSLNDIHLALGINKPSLSRILATLEKIGYVNRNIRTNNFSLSFRTYEIGMEAVSKIDYINVIRNSLSDIATETGLIAQYSVCDHDELLCLESFHQNDSAFSAAYSSAGARSPLYASSAGKAILATYPNSEVMEIIPRMNMHKITENTLFEPQMLLENLSEVRQNGYAFDLAENEYGLYCIGAAIINNTRRAIGAISISRYYSSKEELEQYKDVLLRHTQRLSSLLGGVVI